MPSKKKKNKYTKPISKFNHKKFNHMLSGIRCSCKASCACHETRLSMGYEWDGGYKLAHLVLESESPLGIRHQMVIRLSPTDVIDVLDTCKRIIKNMSE